MTAPEFTLTDQDGKRLSLRDLRGQVTVVTFIVTTCSDTCPLLTANLVGIQRKLGADASKVSFAAITVDPLNDTPPQILIAQRVLASVEQLVEVEPVGELALKGLLRPVAAFNLIRLRQ